MEPPRSLENFRQVGLVIEQLDRDGSGAFDLFELLGTPMVLRFFCAECRKANPGLHHDLAVCGGVGTFVYRELPYATSMVRQQTIGDVVAYLKRCIHNRPSHAVQRGSSCFL